MKRVLALLVAVGAVAALEAPSTASSCDPPLVFEGRTYRGTASEAASDQANVAGTGTLHGCATVEGQPPPREVVVRALHDVPAGVAVAREGDTYSVWLREGFFPQLRSHPLHDTVTIRRPGRLRCGSRVVRRDHVPSQPSELEPLRLRSGFTEVRLKAGTRFSGRMLHGLPFVRKGDTITVTGRRCLRTDFRIGVVLADRVRVSRS